MAKSNLKLAASTEIKIEKGIPPVVAKRGPAPKYPWREMVVGDSFLFPAGLSPSAPGVSARQQSRDGKKFVVSKTAEGVRCWRVE